MMNDSEFKLVSDRLKAVNAVIENLDPAIREAAFELLRPYATSSETPRSPRSNDEKASTPDAMPGLEAFMTANENDQPSANAFAIAAYLYSQFGASAFALDEVRNIASDVGVTIPERCDKTYANAKREKRSLFKSVGKGRFKPTVYGEAFLKQEFGVAKGRRTKRDQPDQ